MPKTPTPNPAARTAPFWARRRAVMAAFAAVVLVGVLAYGGEAWFLLISTLLIEGLFAVFWLVSAMLGGWFVLSYWMPIGSTGVPPVSVATDFDRPLSLNIGHGWDARATGSLRLATAAALGLGIIGVVTLLLGIAGVLNHYTASALLVVLALPQLVQTLRSPVKLDLSAWLGSSSPSSYWWLLAAPFVVIALTGAMLPPMLLWKAADDPHPFDVLEYHLQVPREWYEGGRIVPLRHNAFSYFPMNAEMHDLLAMHLRGGPWEGMYLAQLTSTAFSTVTILAIYGTVRTLRARRGDESRAVPILAACLAAATPWVTLLAPVAYVEPAMLAYSTLAIAWALVGPRSWRAMALAGAFAGLACGVKYTAVPMTLLAVPVATLLLRPKLSSLAIFLAAGLLTFSPWLIRNAVWTHGNPVFPEAQYVLGAAHFTPDQTDRWEQAHAPRPDQRSLPARLRAAADQIVFDWRYGYLLVPLALAAAGLTWRGPEARALLVLLLLITGVWLFATHLQSRFYVGAIPVCVLLVGLMPWKNPLLLAGATLAVAVPSFVRLNALLLPNLGPFGVTDFKDAMPDSYNRLVADGRSIALVGQGNVFLFQLPMTRLRYRTVFDVDASRTPDPIQCWLDSPPRPNEFLLIYPSELERFSRTYAHIPAPPAEMLGRSEPVVVPPG